MKNTSTIQTEIHHVGDQDVVIQCGMCAYPPTPIRWHYRGRALPGDIKVHNGTLFFPSLTARHFGRYTCVMEDRMLLIMGQGQGKRYFSIFLQNEGKPPLSFQTAASGHSIHYTDLCRHHVTSISFLALSSKNIL